MRNDVVVHRVVKNTKQSGQYIELHSHTFFHYIYSLGGHTRTIVGDEAYQTGQGTLLLIPPGVPHEIISLDISSCLDLKFSCSGPLTEEISRLPRYIPLVDSEINSLIHNIFEEAVGQERDYEEVINISLYRVLIQLLRKQEEKKSWQMPITYPVSIPDDENICHILQIIEGAMGKPIQGAGGDIPQPLCQPAQNIEGQGADAVLRPERDPDFRVPGLSEHPLFQPPVQKDDRHLPQGVYPAGQGEPAHQCRAEREHAGGRI